ncbi:LysR family transcriptional regulator [Brevibacterium celere]|uniref:LysR family transcriptional regulator n=1 Tax=Brevibacterium celere TaxID=225845 RepID=UPI0031E0D653
MEIRQLRYFVAVADELHFGRAARKLHMSQPPLSLQVGKLERELGVRLFERSTHSVTLTAAGAKFLDSARRILHDIDRAAYELEGFAAGTTGSLSVGFVSSAGYTLLPEAVPKFRSMRDQVALHLIPLTSGEQLARLSEGTLDLGIVRDEEHGALHALPQGKASPGAVTLPNREHQSGRAPSATFPMAQVVYEERLVACLPHTHPLAQQTEVTPRQISAVPMISYPRELMPGFVDRVTIALGSHASRVTVVEQVIHQETALGFVATGAGTSILPESIGQLLPPTIVAVPLAGSPTTRLIAIPSPHIQQPSLIDTFIDRLRAASGIPRVPNAAIA